MHETHDKENLGASSGADAAFDRHVRLREHNSRSRRGDRRSDGCRGRSPCGGRPCRGSADAPVIEGLTFTEESPLKYATVFRLFRYEGGYTLIRIDNGGDFLVVPEGAAVPAKMDRLPSRCCSSRWTRSILRLPPPCRSSPPWTRSTTSAHRHARVGLVHRRGR